MHNEKVTRPTHLQDSCSSLNQHTLFSADDVNLTPSFLRAFIYYSFFVPGSSLHFLLNVSDICFRQRISQQVEKYSSPICCCFSCRRSGIHVYLRHYCYCLLLEVSFRDVLLAPTNMWCIIISILFPRVEIFFHGTSYSAEWQHNSVRYSPWTHLLLNR